jgi:hypothetical protein
MPLYELELLRPGLADSECLYEGEILRLDDVVAIEDAVWRVAEVSTPVEPSADGRLVLIWSGWRRSELARARAIDLVEESTALVNEARHILKRVPRDDRTSAPEFRHATGQLRSDQRA